MRKLYALVTGLFIILVATKTNGQSNINPQNLFSAISNEIITAVSGTEESPSITNATCQADFEVNNEASSLLTKKFTAIPWNSEQKKPVNICWRFGDGKDTCIQYSNTFPGPYSVYHHYLQPGTYEVCVRIVYEGGCDASKCKQVVVGDYCTADFEKLALEPTTNPLYVTFKALPWNSLNKKPKTICWAFGDGKDTCIEYTENYTGTYLVRHRYVQAGIYQVCVKITYFGGCESYKCKSIRVESLDQCSADFERIATNTTTNPWLTYFRALPWNSNNKKPKTICWRFGDGKDTCINYTENYTGQYVVSHRYNEPGNYEVCVKITYYGGCESYKCKNVQIGEPDSCGADFQRIPLTNTDNPLVVGLQALPSHNNHKAPKVICWSFGDGKDTCIEYAQTFAGPYVVHHRYNAPGTYTVCVKITYYGGCESRNCKPIVVTAPDECRADFEKIAVNSTANPLLAYFRALPWNSNNKKPKTICWRFGDSKDTCINYPENYTGGYAVSHIYNHPDNYEVCIKITYFGGCEAYKCKQITVGNFCLADFEKLLTNTTTSPLLVYYKALPWNSQDKKPKTICWRFGDGKDTCIEYPENYTGVYAVRHEYAQPGSYEVCVKITYYGGCEAYKCKQIQIGEIVQCKADFERIPISTVNNLLYAGFRAIPWQINSQKPKEICWTFGDGKDTCIQYQENYTGQYIIYHKYAHPGDYEVCVKIIYFGGCEARKCHVIKIEAPGECHAKIFELTPSITSLMRGFFAYAWSSENKRPVRVCWYFGDGTDTCVQLEPGSILPGLFIRHTFPAPGIYHTCVKVLFDGGCIAYDCVEVVIRPTTNICGGYMTDSLLSPRTFKFKGFAIHNPDDPVIGYRWTFGDGSSATGQEVTHQYNAPGTYQVCLTINTQRGCETKICKPLHVPGNTESALQISPNPVTSNMHVLFYSTLNEPVVIKVVNGYGVVVRTWTRNATTGANNWDFDVASLISGAYTLYVQSPNQLASQLFIKN